MKVVHTCTRLLAMHWHIICRNILMDNYWWLKKKLYTWLYTICSKPIQIKTKVLHVRREINNHKTPKNVLKVEFDQNLRPNQYSCVWNTTYNDSWYTLYSLYFSIFDVFCVEFLAFPRVLISNHDLIVECT